MRDPRFHSVSLRVGGKLIRDWTAYDIALDMLTPADAFSLSFPRASKEVFDLVAPDEEVEVRLDDTVVLSGFVDEREVSLSSSSGSRITVEGRDRTGRLVDESMPLMDLAGLGIKELAERACGIGDPELSEAWLSEVILSNAENRRLLRGRASKLARVSKEPAIVTDIDEAKDRRHVEPGETRWKVLEYFLHKAKLLAWSTADGKALVVGLPNYDQEPQYRFFVPSVDSNRAREGNVVSYSLRDSVADRFSAVRVVGSARLDPRRDQKDPAGQYLAEAKGTGFKRPKRLIVQDDDIRGPRQARVRAERELAERDATGHHLEIEVVGHGQGGREPVIYAPDTMAVVEIEDLGIRAEYLITSVHFRLSRQDGETTALKLVQKGTVLA